MKSFRKVIAEEPLEELSKSTLKKYIHKALDSKSDADYSMGRIDAKDAGKGINNNKKHRVVSDDPKKSEKSYNDLLKHVEKRKKGIDKAVEKLSKEEVEQIDELSKKTLGSYVNRAAVSMGNAASSHTSAHHRRLSPSKYLKRYGKRFKGIRQATAKLSKEEIEQTLGMTLTDEQFSLFTEEKNPIPLKGHPYHQHDEYTLHHIIKDASQAAKAVQNYDSKAEAKYLDQANDASTILGYRRRGGKKVELTKESVEQIDELSSSLKQRYVKMAKGDIDLLSKAVKWHKDSSRPLQYRYGYKAHDKFLINKHTKKINKRKAGIARANESVEQIDELSVEKRRKYIDRAEKSRDSHHIHADHYLKRKNTNSTNNKKRFYRHMDKASKRMIGIERAKGIVEAIEFSSTRKAALIKLLTKAGSRAIPPKKKESKART